MFDKRAFLNLNEAMAIRAILDAVLAVEKVWDEGQDRTIALSFLWELLDSCHEHRSELIKTLAQLRRRVPENPSYHQFLAIFVPIERQYARMVHDGDFLVHTQDRAEAPLGQDLPAFLILDNIRSAFNVGSILRMAECMRIKKVFLCGYTARPDQDKVKHAAMGTELLMDWEWMAHTTDCIAYLKMQNTKIYALETSLNANHLESFLFPQEPVALLCGNERYGVEATVLHHCHGVISIPCWGQKNSLNVAVAAGITCFELRRQWQISGFTGSPKF